MGVNLSVPKSDRLASQSLITFSGKSIVWMTRFSILFSLFLLVGELGIFIYHTVNDNIYSNTQKIYGYILTILCSIIFLTIIIYYYDNRKTLWYEDEMITVFNKIGTQQATVKDFKDSMQSYLSKRFGVGGETGVDTNKIADVLGSHEGYNNNLLYFDGNKLKYREAFSEEGSQKIIKERGARDAQYLRELDEYRTTYRGGGGDSDSDSEWAAPPSPGTLDGLPPPAPGLGRLKKKVSPKPKKKVSPKPKKKVSPKPKKKLSKK
jgi:hypothetical protein